MDDDGMSSLSSDDDQGVANVQERIDILRETLSKEPYLYEGHVELISLLRSASLIEELRRARESFSSVFPLSPQLWMQWIDDEERMSVKDEERANVVKLLERANKDYLSVPLLIRYVQSAAASEPRRMEEITESVLSSAGAHVSEGADLWEEVIKAAKLLEKPVDYIRSLYERALSVPLLGLERIMEEFEEWESDKKFVSRLKEKYGRSCQELETRLPFEERLKSLPGTPDMSHLSWVQDYVIFEIKQKQFWNVVCIFERYLSAFCLCPEIWHDYLDFFEETFSIPDRVASVSSRAVRNCPSCASLWKRHVLAMENARLPMEDIEAALRSALGRDLSKSEYCDIFVAYVTALNRSCQRDAELNKDFVFEAYESSKRYLAQLGGVGGTFHLDLAMAAISVRGEDYIRDLLAGARTVQDWRRLILVSHVLMARGGNASIPRRVYGRACFATPLSDGAAFADDWLYFEELYGSHGDWQTAKVKTRKLRRDVASSRVESKERDHPYPGKQQTQSKMNRNCVAPSSRKRKWKDETHAEERRKTLRASGPEPETMSERLQETKEHKEKEEDMVVDIEKPEDREEKTGEAAAKIEIDPRAEPRTVFVTNLSYDVTDDDLSRFFSKKVGKVENVIIMKKMGRSRGMGYVHFESQESVQRAISLTRSKLRRRPMNIELSIPPKDADPDYKPQWKKVAEEKAAKMNPPGWKRKQIEVDERLTSHRHTQVSFVPRAVQKSSSGQLKGEESAELPKARTNKEFQDLLRGIPKQ